VAFMIFGFAGDFYMFVVAQLFITLAESLQSGTDVAYIYDYLKQKARHVNYTEVKGKQKFYARIGEGIATFIGGFIAKSLGYNAVFFFAAIPAFFHVILMLSFYEIKEKKERCCFFANSIKHIKDSFKELFSKKKTLILVLNITLFITVVQGAAKFLQPYMKDAGIPVEWFGVIYSFFLVMTAFAVRYSYLLENWWSKEKIINMITFISILPLFIIGFGWVSIIGVALFFILTMGENIRSPIDNHLFHEQISSKRRATLGSVLMLSRNIGLAVFLPFFGYLADIWGFYIVMLLMGGMMIINLILFRCKVPD